MNTLVNKRIHLCAREVEFKQEMVTRLHIDPALLAVERAFRDACLVAGHPNADKLARYLSEVRVKELIREVLRPAQREGRIARRITAVQAQEHLESCGLLQRLAEPESQPPVAPYWLVLLGRSGGQHDPIELLGAASPIGIVSHASALLFHELTQLRIHRHFVTLPVKRRSAVATGAPMVRPERHDSYAPGTHRGRIGRVLFRYGELEFRAKTMIEDLIFGVDTVAIGDAGGVRVFDRERTLLHTLTDPVCNGGIRGLMEAWDRGAESAFTEQIIRYLKRFDSAPLWRRTGAMAQRTNLPDVAEACESAIAEEASPEIPLALVPGLRSGRTLARWAVSVPW